MDHRSFASTRLARKPGCPEVIPGEPIDISGMCLEPVRPDEPLGAAPWVAWLQGLDSGNFYMALGCWVGEEGLWCANAFVWASDLLGVVAAGRHTGGHTRY